MTERTLRDWRFGQTQAERLVAGLLHLEGFTNVDPQHPLGGPDGRKDVLCKKDNAVWIAACHFPGTATTFSEIRTKFVDDLGGVAMNGATGFAFFVNQPLSIGERSELIGLCPTPICEIYHLERLRALLDSPKGCGLRLEYLRIPMTESEQWAFWQAMQVDVVTTLLENERRRLDAFSGIEAKLDVILARTQALEANLLAGKSSVAVPQPLHPSVGAPTTRLDLQFLCWLHRVITDGDGLPESSRGTLRAVPVWVGSLGSTPETARYVPPPPDQILGLLEGWLEDWQELCPTLQGAPKPAIVAGLARFHHGFVRIHPFLDGNGRLARVLADEAAHELLGQRLGADLMSDPRPYYEALAAADRGDMTPLEEWIGASLG